MAKKKAGGSAKNLTDSKPKYLGVKLGDGQPAKPGSIIVRQRGTKFIAGEGVAMGKDHTLFSKIAGIVSFRNGRKKRFDGSTVSRKVVDVA
ncbi:MAG: 50S ribosomal protein L27 [Patescibacteria group bacterium UBA2163]